MPFASVFPSTFRVFEVLVLSVTSHARLSLANDPHDYDLILKRMTREVKFFSETLLTILFFVERPALVSQTLACLMFSLITYVVLESMTGDGLHKWIDEIPCGRIVLACMSKLPALSVLWTLSALALCQWNSLATKIILCVVAGILLLGLVVRLRVDRLVRDVWTSVGESARRVVKGRKRKCSDASVASDASEGSTVCDTDSTDGVEKDGSGSLSGDECV